MSNMFRSLKGRNYRIWFAGALLSNVGGWMQSTAQNWVVLTELSNHTAAAVGITMALQFGPQLLLVPFSGAVADRFDKRRVLLVTQSLLMLCAAGLGVLLVTGVAELWHLYGFALALGIVNAFDSTARQAFVSDLVGPAQLSNAIALNSASFNSARLIGPAIAGLLIAAVGSGWVFLINAVSFLAVIAALIAIRPDRDGGAAGGRLIGRGGRGDGASAAPAAQPEGGPIRQLLAGFSYVRSRPDLVVIFVMVFILGAFSMNFPIVASTMAVEFGKDATDYGLLYTMLAIGSLSGALLAARRPNARMRVVIVAAGGVGLVSLVAAAMPTYITFALSLILLGLATSTLLTTANGFVQTTAAPAVRGRVIALYVAVLMGGTPLGAPLVGAAADAFDARASLVISGVAGLIAFAVGALWLVAGRQLRVRLGAGFKPVVTHAGRPSADADPALQTETLTAPLNILRRDQQQIPTESSVPHDTAADAPATGRIWRPGHVANSDAEE